MTDQREEIQLESHEDSEAAYVQDNRQAQVKLDNDFDFDDANDNDAYAEQYRTYEPQKSTKPKESEPNE